MPADTISRQRQILIVTGASGAGKTATVRAIESRALPGVACFYFDSIGVPSVDEMERQFGGGEKWQAHATARPTRSACPSSTRPI